MFDQQSTRSGAESGTRAVRVVRSRDPLRGHHLQHTRVRNDERNSYSQWRSRRHREQRTKISCFFLVWAGCTFHVDVCASVFGLSNVPNSCPFNNVCTESRDEKSRTKQTSLQQFRETHRKERKKESLSQQGHESTEEKSRESEGVGGEGRERVCLLSCHSTCKHSEREVLAATRATEAHSRRFIGDDEPGAARALDDCPRLHTPPHQTQKTSQHE